MYAGNEATEDAALGRMQVGRIEFAPGYGRWNRAAFGGKVPGPMEVDPRSITIGIAGQSPTDRAASPPTPRVDPWEMWHQPPLTAANDNGRKLPKVVALTGLAGSGKSTLADYLIERHGYVRVKFAGPLKAMARAVGLGEAHIEGELKEVPCPLLQGRTPRFFMQQLGTQFGRDIIGPEFWTGLWAATANDVLDNGGRVVVDDCRFDNEADVVRQFGGVVIQLQGRGGLQTASGSHASEAGVDADVVLRNNGTIADLQARADEVLFGGLW